MRQKNPNISLEKVIGTDEAFAIAAKILDIITLVSAINYCPNIRTTLHL